MLVPPITDSGYVLLIERGQTRFPQRPVNSQRFLIGAGSNCHLQLAGDVPLLHSIIIPDGDHLWIDAVSPYPPLLVNGQPQRESTLHTGDVLEIGAYVFTVGYQHPAVQAAIVNQKSAADMTVAELIEAIQAELEESDALASAREAGATALLQAARASAQNGQTPSQPNHSAPALQLLDELRLRAESLDLREAILQEHARQLEATQAELQRQLESACARISPEPASASPLRLTA